MAQIDVREQLAKRFAAPLSADASRRIVIWHDEAHEFEEDFDQIAADGLQGADSSTANPRPLTCVKPVSGNLFSVKRLIAREDTESDILVYRTVSGRKLDGDWLADVELYAEHFSADAVSLLIDDLGIQSSADIRQALSDFKKFFRSRERLEKFQAGMPNPSTYGDVAVGVFATLLGSALGHRAGTNTTDAPSLIKDYLTLLWRAHEDEDAQSPLELFEKYQAHEAFIKYLSAKIGFGGDCESVRDLGGHLLLSAAVCTLPDKALRGLAPDVLPEQRQTCLAVVRAWMSSGEADRRCLFELARFIEHETNLRQKLEALDVAQLVACDVFPLINEIILSQLLHAMGLGEDKCDEAVRIVDRRKNLEWYAEYSCYFDLLVSVVATQQFYRDHAAGFHLTDLVQIWEAYTSDWCGMDQSYRKARMAFQACLMKPVDFLDDHAREAIDWVERYYTQWFLPEVNTCWTRAAQSQWQEQGWVNGIAQQDYFYEDEVAAGSTSSRGPRCTVVVVSDGLRYGVGKDLAQRLEQTTHGITKLTSMQAIFPSITEFGMAALLPHRQLEFQVHQGRGAVFVDGMPTASTAQRLEVLKARNPKSAAYGVRDYLAMSRDERKELLKNSEVVYLYHNTIDTAGEHSPTERGVFDACEDAEVELCALVSRIVGDHRSARVIITADHGFIYTEHPLQEFELMDTASIPEDAVVSGRRHILCKHGEDEPSMTEGQSLLSVSLPALQGGAYSGYAPYEAVRIKRQGGTRNYVHGGLSLQELCVPVIHFENKRTDSKGFIEQTFACIQLLSTNRKITNSLFSLEFFQTEPVAGKVLAAEYDLVFLDEDDNAVSDRRSIVADKTEPDGQQRVSKVQFSLKAGVTFSSDETYFLVASRVWQKMSLGQGSIEQREQIWREPFQIVVSFAPVDDFGW